MAEKGQEEFLVPKNLIETKELVSKEGRKGGKEEGRKQRRKEEGKEWMNGWMDG